MIQRPARDDNRARIDVVQIAPVQHPNLHRQHHLGLNYAQAGTCTVARLLPRSSSCLPTIII
jgi:hypothetical protein